MAAPHLSLDIAKLLLLCQTHNGSYKNNLVSGSEWTPQGLDALQFSEPTKKCLNI